MKNKKRELTELEKDFIKEKESEGYKIIVQNNNLIVKYGYDEDNNIGIAKCNPTDQFDIKIGFKVATQKMKIDRLHVKNDLHRKYIKDLEKEYKSKLQKVNDEIYRNKKRVRIIKNEIHDLTKGEK